MGGGVGEDGRRAGLCQSLLLHYIDFCGPKLARIRSKLQAKLFLRFGYFALTHKNLSKIAKTKYSNIATYTTGHPSSKYEHRQASALLRNIQNIRICMGKKPIVSVTYENERISIKNNFPYLKCVLRLSWSRLTNPGKPLYREKTVYIKTHKTAINRPVDHTGET